MRKLFLVALVAACGGTSSVSEDAGLFDAGPVLDAGPARDAGSPDAGLPAGPDAGSTIRGAISVVADSSIALANLSDEGPLGWEYFAAADAGTASFSMQPIGGGPSQVYATDQRPLTWMGGPAEARSGLFRIGLGVGFELASPGASTSRTLTLHVAGFQSGGTLTAQLANGSGEYTDITAPAGGQYDRNYQITYAGSDLIVSWIMSSGTGHVNLAGAALR